MNPLYPSLILDSAVCRNNIIMMVNKARIHNLIFRPHFKTHQSATIGLWFKELGVSAITVSSVPMARYFSRYAWNDITVALPINPLAVPEINTMDDSVKINLLIDSPEVLSASTKLLLHDHDFWIKVDNGYGRAGILSSSIGEILTLARQIENHPKHRFAGILIHHGDHYHCNNPYELLERYHQNLQRLIPLSEAMKECFPGALVSWGDTPSCTVADDFAGIDEIRPGNFVFYDMMQVAAGVCSLDDVAVTLAAPVLSLYPDQGKMLLHAGAVHLSKEKISTAGTRESYGMITRIENGARGELLPALKLLHLSQEHAVVTGPGELLATFRPGDYAGIIPVHACLTADLMKSYLTTTGERIPMMPSPSAYTN
jgi:D-serine deaminase-like pyridoxal phosphate-dependent protein